MNAESDITVVIPALNAGATIADTIAALAPSMEVIVVDGGSGDGTRAVAEKAGARVITASAGRGCQIAAGIALATRPWLLLLHADTRLQPGWRDACARHMVTEPRKAGWFQFTLDSANPQARRLERMVAWRSSVLGLPYGDQGLLLHSDLLRMAGGMRPLPLMEDVDLIRRLGRHWLSALPAAALTSAARWERDGWYRRSLRNLGCLALWFLGAPPALLVRLYR